MFLRRRNIYAPAIHVEHSASFIVALSSSLPPVLARCLWLNWPIQRIFFAAGANAHTYSYACRNTNFNRLDYLHRPLRGGYYALVVA